MKSFSFHKSESEFHLQIEVSLATQISISCFDFLLSVNSDLIKLDEAQETKLISILMTVQFVLALLNAKRFANLRFKLLNVV
jgi:hypothetical protein